MKVLITSLLFENGQKSGLPHLDTAVVEFETFYQAQKALHDINVERKSLMIGSFTVIRHAEII